MNIISGVYKITNLLNCKIYIGSTKNITKRFKSHLAPGSGCKLLKAALKKYGKDNFKFEIIEEVEVDNLINREQYYLDTLLFAQDYIKGNDLRFLELGYNICPTASSREGVKELNTEHKFTPILEYSKNGDFIKLWPSIKSVESFYKISGVSKICKTNGYPDKCNSVFRYYTEDYPLKIEVKNKRIGRTVIISEKQKKQISKSLLGKYGKNVEIIDTENNKIYKFNTKIEAFTFLNICNNTFTKAIKKQKYKKYKIKLI